MTWETVVCLCCGAEYDRPVMKGQYVHRCGWCRLHCGRNYKGRYRHQGEA